MTPVRAVGRPLARLLLGATLACATLACATREPTPAENGPEARFARAMAMHHEQAVEMALVVRDRSADSAIRHLALDILLTQQAQIGQMQGWLAAWRLSLGGSAPPMSGAHSPEHMGMATRAEVASLSSLPIRDAERAFLELMIRHHRGGTAMAEEALRATQRPEVRRLATAIIESQRGEIQYMEQLKAARPQR
jgi:uncharacterized protein (DUF305 family)